MAGIAPRTFPVRHVRFTLGPHSASGFAPPFNCANSARARDNSAPNTATGPACDPPACEVCLPLETFQILFRLCQLLLEDLPLLLGLLEQTLCISLPRLLKWTSPMSSSPKLAIAPWIRKIFIDATAQTSAGISSGDPAPSTAKTSKTSC